MLYTRKGDDGTSGLFGSKTRLGKESLQFEALGTLDELNSHLGLTRALAADITEPMPLAQTILRTQEDLFIVQASLAGADKQITQDHIDTLEVSIAKVEALIENPNAFVVPGANELSAHFDIARTVARRAERAVIRLGTESDIITKETKAYLNRISSLLYACARYTAQQPGSHEHTPSYT